MSCTTTSGNFTQARLAQITNYEYESYQYQTTVLTHVSYVLIFLIILLILRNSEIMPESLFSWLFIPVLTYLILYILYALNSFLKRGPINFDTYIWKFKKQPASGNISTGGGTGAGAAGGGGQMNQITATVQCANSACCQSGMAWDSTIGKCTLIN
jgi:hypothetical protein